MGCFCIDQGCRTRRTDVAVALTLAWCGPWVLLAASWAVFG